jgi:RNA polymerase sigma-70 factor (ECF subfamily)
MEPTARERFDEFYQSMYPGLVRGLRRILGDVYDPQDIAQEALQDAWRAWERISVYDSPEAWTWRVALNVRADRMQRRRREQAHHSQLGPASTDPASELADQHHLWALVAMLPYAQRATIVLRYVTDLSFSQIAEVMGCSASGARQNHRKGKQRLVALLAVDGTRNG